MANHTVEKEDLEQYTVAELKDMAAAEGVEVAYDARKDEIIKAIEKHRKAGGKAHNAESAKADQKHYNSAELRDKAKEAGIHVAPNATDEEIAKSLGEEGVEINPLALTGAVVPLPIAGVTADAYGVGRKYNIATADINTLGAAVQGNFLLENLPAGSLMQLVRIKHSQSVTGTGPITACTAQVGDGTNLWGAAFDIFAAPTNAATGMATVQLNTTNIGPIAAVYPVYLTLIATGGNLATATAGALSVWLRWTVLL
jgi:hypothetical protein